MKISYFGEVSAEQPSLVERRRLKTKKNITQVSWIKYWEKQVKFHPKKLSNKKDLDKLQHSKGILFTNYRY